MGGIWSIQSRPAEVRLSAGQGAHVTLQDLLNAMSRALEGLAGLPWGVHIAVAFALASGLIIWLVGEKFLKPMVVLLCAMLGAVMGLLLTTSTPWGASGTLGAYHHLFIGLGVGTVLGFLVYRSATALGFGVVLGLLLPLGAAGVLNAIEPGGAGGSSTGATARVMDEAGAEVMGIAGGRVDDVRFAVRMASYMQDVQPGTGGGAGGGAGGGPSGSVPPTSGGGGALRVEKVPENLKPAAEAITNFWTKLRSEAEAGWMNWSGRNRAVLATLGALGLVVGVVWGLSVPKWSGIAITSLFGAAVWLPAMAWLSNAMNAPWKTMFDLSALHWLMLWGGVGVFGMIVQYSGIIPGTRKKKAVGAPAPVAVR